MYPDSLRPEVSRDWLSLCSDEFQAEDPPPLSSLRFLDTWLSLRLSELSWEPCRLPSWLLTLVGLETPPYGPFKRRFLSAVSPGPRVHWMTVVLERLRSCAFVDAIVSNQLRMNMADNVISLKPSLAPMTPRTARSDVAPHSPVKIGPRD